MSTCLVVYTVNICSKRHDSQRKSATKFKFKIFWHMIFFQCFFFSHPTSPVFFSGPKPALRVAQLRRPNQSSIKLSQLAHSHIFLLPPEHIPRSERKPLSHFVHQDSAIPSVFSAHKYHTTKTCKTVFCFSARTAPAPSIVCTVFTVSSKNPAN